MITKKFGLIGQNIMFDSINRLHRTDHKQDTIDEIIYSLHKRIPNIYRVSGTYGDIYLDDKAIVLVKRVLNKHYESELKKLSKSSTKPLP